MKMRGIPMAVLAAALAMPPAALHASGINLENERTLSEILQDKRMEEARQRGDYSRRDSSAEEQDRDQAKEDAEGKKESRRAILPEIGFSPEKGANGGIKFTDRDIRGLTLDLSASAAQMGQYKGRFALVAPELFSGWLILLAGGEYLMDPTYEFFGLGNNDVGPDELSTHELQRTIGTLAVALRLTNRFTAVVSGEYTEIQIHRGDRRDGVPSTVDVFPNLAGIGGGKTNPISAALIFNDRDDVTRPTRGWNVISKYQRIDEALDNDFEFDRYIFEASYLYPFLTRRQVIGVRGGGEYISTKKRRTPFFQFSSLGGGDDMRGYFLDRFLGLSK
ncbi:MAG: BamA/TamA family outer membrane protein, partial [Candidatus Binatia bacterium]